MTVEAGSIEDWRINRQDAARCRRRFQASYVKPPAGNDSFLWSLADLMTLLLVFFIMLYSNAITTPLSGGQSSEKNDSAPLADDKIDGVFSEYWIEAPVVDVGEKEAKQKLPEAAEEEALTEKSKPAPQSTDHRLLAELKGNFNEDFYVRWEDKQPIIVLGERITFRTGEAHLLVGARKAILRVAALISRAKPSRIIVTGHTDNRPIHTNAFPSNWELSAGRAASVAKALMEYGVSPDRLVIQGQSQFNPLAPNTSEGSRRGNRRVEISLITG